MSQHTRRIERLEHRQHGGGIIWVIQGPDGITTEEAKKLLGLTPSPNDLVVYIRKPDARLDSLCLLYRKGMAAC